MAVSWSGGKDSCHLLMRALAAGYRVASLFNLQSRKDGLSLTPPFNPRLLALQASALGLPLLRVDAAPSPRRRLREFFRALKAQGVEAVGCGYIDPAGQRDCFREAAELAGLRVYEPFCGRGRKGLLRAALRRGIKALTVGVDGSRADVRLLGKKVDGRFLKCLELAKVDYCGENGEFHTFVTDCPLFSARVEPEGGRELPLGGTRYLYFSRARLREKRGGGA